MLGDSRVIGMHEWLEKDGGAEAPSGCSSRLPILPASREL